MCDQFFPHYAHVLSVTNFLLTLANDGPSWDLLLHGWPCVKTHQLSECRAPSWSISWYAAMINILFRGLAIYDLWEIVVYKKGLSKQVRQWLKFDFSKRKENSVYKNKASELNFYFW